MAYVRLAMRYYHESSCINTAFKKDMMRWAHLVYNQENDKTLTRRDFQPFKTGQTSTEEAHSMLAG